MDPSTSMIHLGRDKEHSGAVMPSITLSTTFERKEDGLSFPSDYVYSRYDTPNRHSLEVKLASLEQGEVALAFASGLTAAMAVFHSLSPGDHILLPDDTYFGVRNILIKLYKKWGLEFSLVDMADTQLVKKSIQPNTRLVWMESPSNPCMKITDIEAITRLVKSKSDILVAVDNTWATPYHTLPLTLGADIVHHSTTKYLGGHSDVLGGALIFKEKNERYEFIKSYQMVGGAVPSPFDCWLLNRSLATFHARMPIHNHNAMKLATFLSTQDKIEKVMYPGLKEDAGHAIALRQMQLGFGGMLSILVKGDRKLALKLCGTLKIIRHATSLGGVESLIEHRKSIEGETSTTPDNLLRISVGIEHIDDLIVDFRQALEGL